MEYTPVRDEARKVAGVLWTLKETTAQVLAERALRESETRHRLLIGTWAQAVWETDPAGTVVADSPSWRKHTGQTLDEWLDYGWLNAVHPDDHPNPERQWRDAIATCGLVDAEFRLRAPGGGWRWTNVRAAPVLDAAGRIEKWAGMNIDIDARKQAKAALRESEEHLEAELEHATLLRDLAARLVTEGSETAIYQEILSAAIIITKSVAGSVQVYEPESSSLVVLVAEGVPPTLTSHFQRVDAATSTACGIALRTGRRSFVDYDGNLVDETCRMHVEAGTRGSWVAHDRVCGIIFRESRDLIVRENSRVLPHLFRPA